MFLGKLLSVSNYNYILKTFLYNLNIFLNILFQKMKILNRRNLFFDVVEHVSEILLLFDIAQHLNI